MNTYKSLQMKEEFQITISKFAHEIRNPLSLISSELQLLAEQHPEITEYKDWDVIFNNLLYIEDLLKDFSTYGNAGELSLTSTALSEYLYDLIQTIRPTLDYLNIRLVLQISSALPHILLDQKKFRQAFLNLIRNAQEAVPASGGVITIACYSDPDQKVHLSISDNGCGLSQEQLSQVFTPFVTYKSTGTGLGLPIARQIIESHGGTLQITSIPGQGCSLFITLGG